MARVHVELDAGVHAWADAAYLVFFEIGIHPPLAVIDQLKQRLARFDVLANADAETIADVVGFDGEIVWDTTKPNGTPKRPLDYSKISALGWKPKHKLREGLEKSYQWFLENCV